MSPSPTSMPWSWPQWGRVATSEWATWLPLSCWVLRAKSPWWSWVRTPCFPTWMKSSVSLASVWQLKLSAHEAARPWGCPLAAKSFNNGVLVLLREIKYQQTQQTGSCMLWISSEVSSWGCTCGGVYVPCSYHNLLTCQTGESYGKQYRSLLMRSCDVFEALNNSLCLFVQIIVIYNIYTRKRSAT